MSYVYHMSSPGYSVVGNSSPGMVKSPAKAPGQSHIKRGNNLFVSSSSFGRSVDDVKDLHEVLPILKSKLSESVSVLYKKLEERDVGGFSGWADGLRSGTGPAVKASLQQEPVVGQFAADHLNNQTYGRRPQRYDIRELDLEYVPHPIGEISALDGKRVNFDGSLGLEGTRGLQLLDVMNSSAGHEDDDDGIMGLSRSPSSTSCGSGGPVEFSPEEPLELPPLGEWLGPFVQTSKGRLLRSMTLEIFKNAKRGGNLIMQVSKPVAVPAEMGSGIMDGEEECKASAYEVKGCCF
nr:hypothetical protein [Tanacetum cinerariifolium]